MKLLEHTPLKKRCILTIPPHVHQSTAWETQDEIRDVFTLFWLLLGIDEIHEGTKSSHQQALVIGATIMSRVDTAGNKTHQISKQHQLLLYWKKKINK